eukprot:gene16306-19394_t
MTMAELKREIVDILVLALKNDKHIENKLMCLWGLSVVAMEELTSPTQSSTQLVNEIVETIIANSLHNDQSVARTALDALSSLSLVFSRLERSTVALLLNGLCAAILRGVNELEFGSTANEGTVAHHFYCLLDWMCLDPAIFDDYIFLDFRGNLFTAIELALGQRGEMWSNASYETGDSPSYANPRDQFRAIANKSLTKKGVPATPSKSSPSPNGSLKSAPEVETPTNSVYDAAETLLSHCLNFIHHFPSKEGPEVVSALIDEADDVEQLAEDQMPLFSVLNESALVSIVEVAKPDGSGTLARLFIRDATGKYVWNFDHTYDASTTATSPPMPVALIRDLASASDIVLVDGVQYQFENRLSSTLVVPHVPRETKLAEMLVNLARESPECLSASAVVDQPLGAIKPTLFTEFTRIQAEVDAFIAMESLVPVAKAVDSWALQRPPRASPVTAQASRLLMHHLGLLDMTRAPALGQLDSTLKLGRALQQLDITPSREILKIGVIYVGEGQDDQRDILHNDAGSPLYESFVDGLGWPVDLRTHQGYLGGLDKKKSTGTHAPYYANTTLETIFHNITSMPTNLSDPQQIHKKRHVGNDIVNVIWSEHINDYSPTTITSQFNDAHIVVYPLSNGLFRVQIYRKESKVPLFGPLIHGMAVNKQLLSTLVRQTAINAYRYVRNNTPNYSKPYVSIYPSVV